MSDVNGINQLFTMNNDGSNKKQITNLKNSCYYPFYSPDGNKIVFMSLIENNTIICIVDSNGGNYKCLTKQTDKTSDPSWSPDGTNIIFSSEKEGNNEIYLMDLNGNNWRQLTDNPASDQTPSISPDGKNVVFASNRDGNNELYIMDIDGKNVRRLTIDPRSDRVPRWSANSEKIIWYSREPSTVAGSGKKSWAGAEIYEIDKDGSNRKQITNNYFRDQSPFYSPDGKSILFTSKRTGINEIFILNMVTSIESQLTKEKK